jgi:thiamine transport system permease protein
MAGSFQQMSETLTRTRPVQTTPAIKSLAGVLALGFLASLVGGSLIALGLEASGFSFRIFLDPYLQRIARFTIWQAVLSSLISVLFAIPVARALY